MVITENDSDEILTLDRTSITIAERDHAKETRAVSSRQEISQEKNPLPYSKAIQIRTNICQDEHKTLEQRIADIEFNLKKLRTRSSARTFPGKEKLSLNRVQREA